MSAITVFKKDAAAPAAGAGPGVANHSAWLEQLESAQWQQRLRYQPGGQQQRPAAQAGTGGEAQTRSRPAPAAAGGDKQFHATSDAARAASAPGSNVVTATANTGAARASAANAGNASSPQPAQRPLMAGSDHDSVLPQLGRRLPAVTWQAQHAHVRATENGLQVWLRDARHQETDGLKLLRELRSRFAQLGLRLAQFTLNGKQVAQATHLDQQQD
ncbi:MAG: hypothetical protein V4632_22590 [Pseudomonadota bacterium]